MQNGEKVKMQQQERLIDVQDAIGHCLRKVNFLRDFFSLNVPCDELLSEHGAAGLSFILGDLEEDLESVDKQLDESRRIPEEPLRENKINS